MNVVYLPTQIILKIFFWVLKYSVDKHELRSSYPIQCVTVFTQIARYFYAILNIF